MKKALLRILVVFLILLVGLRLALPNLIKKKVNEKLARLPDYSGRVNDVSLSLWLADVSLIDLVLTQRNGSAQLTIERFETRIRWLPLLFHRHVIGILTVKRPQFSIKLPRREAGKKEKESKKVAPPVPVPKTAYLPDLLQSLIPFKVEAFYLADGQLHIREAEGPAKVDATRINVTVTNLANSKSVSDNLTAQGEASAYLEKGEVNLKMKINPMAKPPAFHLRADAKNLDLTQFNSLFDRLWGVAVERGSFSVFSEASAADGAFKGYAKPIVADLKMQKSHGALQAVKNAVIGVMNAVLKNPETNTVASETPFQGKFENPQAGIWASIVEVLRHGFVEALRPRFDKNFKPNPHTAPSTPAP